jgi:hypothetical protein
LTGDSSTEIPDLGHRRPRSGNPLRHGTDVAGHPWVRHLRGHKTPGRASASFRLNVTVLQALASAALLARSDDSGWNVRGIRRTETILHCRMQVLGGVAGVLGLGDPR